MKRDDYIDILKGIGIISIVIGHGSWRLPVANFPIGPFVYTYHLMLFFFVNGMCFNDKNAVTPFKYIGKKLKSLVPTCYIYGGLFIVLHNLLLDLHMIPSTGKRYGISDYILRFFDLFTLRKFEMMAGAFWFLPVLFWGSVFFCFLLHFMQKNRLLALLGTLGISMIGIAGLYANRRAMFLIYHFQTVFLGMPVIALGKLFSRYKKSLFEYLNVFILAVSALLTWVILEKSGDIIELSVNSIISPYLFYPLTCIGIVFCLSLGKIIYKIQGLKSLFSYIGKNSYHIMALHIFAFKIVDIFYGIRFNIEPSVYEKYPRAFDFYCFYYVAGILFPLCVIKAVRLIQSAVVMRIGIQEK